MITRIDLGILITCGLLCVLIAFGRKDPPPVPAPVAVPVPVATNRLSSGIWSGTVIEAGDTTFSITGSSPLIRQHWDGTRRVTTITMDNTNDVVVVTNTVTELDVRIRGHRVRASLPDLPQNDQRKEP